MNRGGAAQLSAPPRPAPRPLRPVAPVIEVERSWRELDRTLDDLEQRRFSGKAVLRVD